MRAGNCLVEPEAVSSDMDVCNFSQEEDFRATDNDFNKDGLNWTTGVFKMINVMGSLLLEEQETWYVKTPHLHAAIMMLSSNRSHLMTQT